MSLSKIESVPVQDLNDSGCVQDTSVCENGFRKQVQLLDLSDDVLLYILRCCTPRDLKALGFTCSRLAALICDHTLWQIVDCRDVGTGKQRMKWLLTHGLRESTTELKIRGYVDKNSRCLGINDPVSPFPFDNNMGNSHSDDLTGDNTVDNVLFGMWYPHLPRCLGINDPVSPFPFDNNMGNSHSDDLTGDNTVDNVLFGMWYPHLPRFTISPRWPDSKEKNNTGNSTSAEMDLESSEKPTTSNQGNSNQKEGNSKQNQEGNSSKNSMFSEENKDENQENMCCNSLGGNSGNSEGNKAAEEGNSVKSEAIKQPTKSGDEMGNRKGNSDNEAGSSSASAGPSTATPSDSKPSSSGLTKKTQLNSDKKDNKCPGPQFPFTAKLIRDLKLTCKNLTTLYLEDCDIDYKTTNLSQFPPKLKKLSLRGTRCYNQPLHSSYLCKIQDYLPDLEYLDVSYCEWFEPASLMPLSKVPKLKELHMCRCVRLTECVAYASLAARYGFRSLKILDVRGCPVADSEVAAFGWLPLLEELYVSPPPDEPIPPDHVHKWAEPLPDFDELEEWEIEEPEFFASKSSQVPDSPPTPEDAGSEINEAMNNIAQIREYRTIGSPSDDAPWGSYERRIIVIQPNANREMVVQQNRPSYVRITRRFPRSLSHNRNRHESETSEAGSSKRPHNDEALDLVKRPRHNNPQENSDNDNNQDENSSDDDNSREDPSNPNNPRENPNNPNNPRENPNNPNNPRETPNNPNNYIENPNHPNNPQENPRENPNNPNNIRENPNIPNNIWEYLNNPNNPAENPDNPNNPAENPNNRYIHIVNPNNLRQDHLVNYRLPEDPPCLSRVIVQMADNSQVRSCFHNNCRDLVTDHAVFRFGRGENEHIVHLGTPPANDNRARPDRSNLRVLSITGYRNITDRSLVHLATAAPHLRLIDFSNTRVTGRGVETFKALRSECKVIYSDFD